MKHWKTTLAGIVCALSWLCTNLMEYRDLMGEPKRPWAAHLMLLLSSAAAIALVFLAWHSADKDHVDSPKK